jgi:mannosylglycoprotein endo-beta-mannosidase
LDEEGWAARYHLEEQPLHLIRVEEEHWKQRGRTRWALQGDANTAYFHAVANGRRCKCQITMLNTPLGPITDQRLIQEHVYAFYRELLGTSATRCCGLAPETWQEQHRVSPEENNNLALTFSEAELENIINDMKTNTAPGPDGLPVIFFKSFWPLVKRGILHILNDFVLGRIDISRLNFAILTLIPKVLGADLVSQFRPIALINVIFKIISKAFAYRLDPLPTKQSACTKQLSSRGGIC